MFYSIGEVAETIGIATSTIRYYDREGFFPNVARSAGGLRIFTDADIDTFRMIECLKSTEMPIKDIKRFLDWCHQGDCSLAARRAMFYERKEIVERQMKEIQKTFNMIRYKCWYYDTALQAGTEAAAKNIAQNELPQDILALKESFSK